jgi:4-amino-4-deoxychorismate lyase
LIETIRVRGRRVPLLDRHLARLERSLRELGLPQAERDLAARLRPFAHIEEGIVRIEVTDGQAAISVRELKAPPSAVITASTPHEPYRHKSAARHCFDAALAEAQGAGADDALLLTRAGWVAEGSTWSVFWWHGEQLCTPALEGGVLPGVARGRVSELLAPTEGTYTRAALSGHSLFLTNAVHGIVPIRSLDGVPLPEDPRTAALAHRFWPAGE